MMMGASISTVRQSRLARVVWRAWYRLRRPKDPDEIGILFLCYEAPGEYLCTHPRKRRIVGS